MKFDDKPFVAIWETTQACDLHCHHCRAEARPDRNPGELSTVEARKLLEQFAAAEVPLVILTGGDPAKRPDLVELVQYGKSLGLTMGLTPSATPLVTPELLEALQRAGIARFAMSIDGASADVHDAFRGSPGSFERTLFLLRTARSLGIPTQINTTLHAGSLGHLDELAALSEELRIVLWSVFAMVPTGRATLALMPTAEQVETAFERLLRIAKTSPFAVKTTAGAHYRRLALQERKETGTDVVIGARGRQALWVNEGRGFLFVSHLGRIFPSGFLPVDCGSVRQRDPITVYRDHPTFRLLRSSNLLEGKCGVCDYRHTCGGSRARAFAMTRNLMGPDPLCAYVPPGYDGPLEIFDGRSARRHLTMLA
ncbi:MAG TPA: TIGR04053 family radical SAM/SPASM domain-containing protein [Polyangiaceae bacterium]|nr:TIGR04053 family radical SAM/SPASM domain-containing protein [Polyangiaceae bacterium]